MYSYVYAAAASWGQCSQPQVCSALLRALHCEQLGHLASCYRGGAGPSNAATSSSGTITTTHTSATGSSGASRRPLQQANQIQPPPPYRTGSHFGFNSPRQLPRTEHKHLPAAERERHGYRPMQRAISYEEIFASPRYEHLCQYCFEQLLRLKPELQRIGGGVGGASSCEEEFSSIESSNVMTPTHHPKQLPPVPELVDDDDADEFNDMMRRPGILRDASTQTRGMSSASTTNFLRQIERFNFSEESANVGYSPGLVTSEMSIFGLEAEQPTVSSAGASATSAPPPRIYHPHRGDITEVWSFGRWQEPQDFQTISGHQPLTEHRLTLEITEHFEPDQMDDQGPGEELVQRQLMTRDERQRRKSEFEELWQDHVEYYTVKEELQHEEAKTVDYLEHTVQICLDENGERSYTFRAQDWRSHGQELEEDDDDEEQLAEVVPIDDTLTEPTDELPRILENFEESLTLAGENLEKLVATTKKMQTLDVQTSSSSLWDRALAGIGNLYASNSSENLPLTDQEVTDQASELEQEQDEEEIAAPSNTSLTSNGEEMGDPEEEEKRDDEKPVTPDTPEMEEQLEPSEKEKEIADEKDIDENELKKRQDLDSEETGLFTPLEQEILQRIETDRLDESEPIFGKIDHTIRNKLTPKKLQDLVSEEIFRTCTHVYTSSPTSVLDSARPGEVPSTASGSSLSAHNISAPCSSTAHTHLVIRPSPRMSRSWAEDGDGDGDREDRKPQEPEEEEQHGGVLDRAVSSTTFVCRPSVRHKRNFIQENIRNACRPRVGAGAVQKQRTNVSTGSLAARSSPTSVCAFQCGQRDSGARLWVSLPTPPRSASGSKRCSTASPTRTLYSVRRSPTSPYPKRRKPLVILPPLRGANLVKKPSNTFEPSSSSLSLHKSMSTSTYFVPSDEQDDPDADKASTHTFQIKDLNEEQEDLVEPEEPVEPTESEEPGNNSQADKANATNSTLYYSANSTREETDRSQPSGDGTEEELGVMPFRAIENEENPESSYLGEASSRSCMDTENTSQKSEEEVPVEETETSVPENDIESTIMNLLSGESQIPTQSEDSEAYVGVDDSSEVAENGERSTSPPEVSEEQAGSEEADDRLNASEMTTETEGQLEDEPRRLDGGSEPKIKSAGSSDKGERSDDDDDTARSSFSLTKAREFNPIRSDHTYARDALSSDEDKAEERVIRVTKSDTNMAKDDNQPSTSKAATADRQRGGAEAEAIPQPPMFAAASSFGREDGDGDVVILETTCTVVGRQMLVREVVGVELEEKEDQSVQSNGWIQIEGMMGEDFVGDDDDEAQESDDQEIDEVDYSEEG